MRSLPEAYVKTRTSRHHQAHEQDYENEQTQDPQGVDGNDSENDNWEEPPERRRPDSDARPVDPWVEKNTLSLPSDEDDGVDGVRKEVREQKKRETNRKVRRKTVKPFPLKPTDTSDENNHVSHKVCMFLCSVAYIQPL
jgi:hypothetical protein